jgi:hypothetical protein
MLAKAPMPGPGHFQWSTGGWFGSQLGGTAWMLVASIVLALQTPWIAAWWVLCFALANAAGVWLWLHRDRLRPYLAMQGLLAICGATGLLAVAALHLFGPAGVRLGVAWHDGRFILEGPPGTTLRSAYATLLLIVPGLMAFFALMERAGRRARSGA